VGYGDILLSPLLDHNGRDTPSEASRILLIATLVSVSIWAWPMANGMPFIWLLVVLFVSTPILSFGWWALSLLGRSRKSRELTPSVGKSKEI
tara:strand:+ start:123 stop:398 length:276 start_codon:yes stop_codon:yes gene_type:complete